MKNPIHFDIHVDGSCLKNGLPGAEGGWAFVATVPNSTEIIPDSEFLGKLRAGTQTNNRAELEGILRALLWIEQQPTLHCYAVFCDSELVVKGVTGESGRKANRDIWEPVERLCRNLRSRITIHAVNSHQNSDDPREVMNNYVDRLAQQASNSLLLEPVEAYN